MGCMTPRRPGDTCPSCRWRHDLPPESSLHLPAGTLLHEQYLMGRVLGHGGFGVTYLAWDVNLATKVAIKEYLPAGIATRNADAPAVVTYSGQARQDFEWGLEKFLEEARLLARFKTVTHIASVLNFFRANSTAYMVMEYLEGGTLGDRLMARGGKIPPAEALPLLMPVLQALAEVHRDGVLHRDISPDNIYITQTGVVKLLDFGAARFALGQQSRNLSVILKEGFSPEEQYRAKGVQGPWTDIYAAAATLYCAVTGIAPPPALDRMQKDEIVPPRALCPALPERAERAMLTALAVRLTERFQTVEEFASALYGREPGAGGETFAAAQAPTIRRAAEPPAAARLPRWIAVAAAVLLLGAAAAGAWLYTRTPPAAAILVFAAEPSQVRAGEPVTLRWSTRDGAAVSLEPGIGQQPGSGSVVVRPAESTEYVLNVAGRDGAPAARRTSRVLVAAPAAAEQAKPVPENGGRRFSVVHYHGGKGLLGGIAGRLRKGPENDSCIGTLAVRAGTVAFQSPAHLFSRPLAEVEEVKRNRRDIEGREAFHIRFRGGENHNFVPRGGMSAADAALSIQRETTSPR